MASIKEQFTQYEYKARDSAGELVTGTLVAEDDAGALQRLQAMGYTSLSLKSVSAAHNSEVGMPKKRLKAKDLAVFTRQFGTMLEAGVPIVDVLYALQEQSTHPKFVYVLPRMRADVEQGFPLSSSMKKFPEVFPPMVSGLIEAAEEPGTVPEALISISEEKQREAELNAKVVAATTQPMITLTLAVLVMIGMLIFLVPMIADTYTKFGAELPLPTKMLLLLSAAAKIGVPLSIVSLIFFIPWWRRNKYNRSVREFIDPIKIKIPIIGKLIYKVTLARFTRSMESLLKGGVSTMDTLETVANTVNFYPISDALVVAKQDVSNGKDLSTALSKHDIFPPQLVYMMKTGEQAGALPKMLDKAAETYEADVESISDNLSAALGPILTIVVGVITGFILLALYLPVLGLYSFL